MTKRTLGVLLAVLIVAALAGGGMWWKQQEAARQADRAATTAVQDFAAAWSQRSFAAGKPAFQDPAAAASFTAVTAGLANSAVKVSAGDVTRTGKTARADLSVTWTLPGTVAWSYRAPVTAVETATGWAIAKPTSGSYWHPQLQPGETLMMRRTHGTRGDLLDRAGNALMPMGTVYPVQLDPTRANAASATALEKVVEEPAGSLVKKLTAAQKTGSKSPIAVVTYRQGDFDKRRAALDAITGVIYPKAQQPLAKTRTFGQPLLGSFGEVTAEMIAKNKGRYAVGDRAGTSGLQGQYDTVLGGSAGVSVATSSGKVLFEKAATAGTPVKLTLAAKVQEAAESALAGAGPEPSAIVAVDIPSGGVLAAANSPATGFDRALTGHYAPGSALKVASTYALLSQGVTTPTTKVSCPKTFVVDGMSVKNYEGEELGTPTFTEDFAHSCNTAFVQLAAKLGAGDLHAAAAALGVGAGWADTLGVQGTFDGSIPVANGTTDKAAGVIGQARNEVSPVALAVMAASVARGSYIPPALVAHPVSDGSARTPKPLDANVTRPLQALMRQVVTGGTGQVLAGTPGGPVSGKTGTAEFGNAKPPETRAWFVGYQGNTAFAVLVEKGKSGGTVAAPVAKKFLTALARR